MPSLSAVLFHWPQLVIEDNGSVEELPLTKWTHLWLLPQKELTSGVYFKKNRDNFVILYTVHIIAVIC